MKTISAAVLTDTVAQLCIKANTSLPEEITTDLFSFGLSEYWPFAKVPP